MIQQHNKEHLNDICILIGENGGKREVFCAEIPITSNEYFSCYQGGIEVKKCLVVNTEEYENEAIVEYSGEKLAVYRRYSRYDGKTEIYLEKKMGIA